MRTRNPPKLIMIVSLIMQLIMSCLVFQCMDPNAQKPCAKLMAYVRV